MSEAFCQSPPTQITVIAPSRRVPTLYDELKENFLERPRELHPKYFYDERGSQLFDQICDTPEYYLTRTEFALLAEHGKAIIERCQPDNILELGSGTSRKSRLLLDAWQEQGGGTYWPFDVSEEMLSDVAQQLDREYSAISIHGLVGDYTAGFGNFPDLDDGRTLAMFVGSTLGNFAPEFARHFLVDFASHLKSGDFFLLGTDLHKDPAVISAAYNDTAGVTAAFNRNVLSVMNQRLGSNFHPDQFLHEAIYNEPSRQIEMYLISDRAQTVDIPAMDRKIEFREGERILTEISRKFTLGEIDDLLNAAGLEPVERYVSDDRPFALSLSRKR